MLNTIKTRDWALVALIKGATKSGVHRDNRKHLNKNACRGNETAMYAKKRKPLQTFDWTRPAQYQGEELFEIAYDESGEIIEANLIDEDGYSVPFNLSSFNEEEMASIKKALQQELDSFS